MDKISKVFQPPFEFHNVIGGLNLDAFPAIGKSKDITIIGYGASELEAVLDKHASVQGKYLAPDKSPEAGFFYRSDHINFAKKGIPKIYADPGIDLVDGGIEKGSDIIKYLCLGANLVAIGRPAIYGLSLNGSAGVSRIFEILKNELTTAMINGGFKNVKSFNKQRLILKNFQNYYGFK